MEFYLSQLFLIRIQRSFNSQRDGILQILIVHLDNLLVCFNSQRDGILHDFNSTSSKVEYSFNSQRDGILRKWLNCSGRFVKSFNSQRDGILRKKPWNLVECSPVSIPNGMEFYFPIQAKFDMGYPVSIPNGMEFYLTILRRNFYNSGFQFPTGWNSTDDLLPF